jgi:hypothetical protein
MAVFDWYQATVEESPVWLRDALQTALPGSSWADCKQLSGFAKGEELMYEGQGLLKMNYGGHNPFPNLVADGAPAQLAADLIRKVSPAHLVSRADACVDVDQAGWFEKTFAVMVDLVDAHRVKPQHNGDWITQDGGRTFYLGAPSSPTRVRLYEKGKQLRNKFPEAADSFPDTWCRLEIQVRPAKRDKKMMLASVAPEAFWGCSAYSQELAYRVLDADTPRLKVGTVWRASELERAEYYLLRQYERAFRAMYDRLGSWEAVGTHIGRKLDDPRSPEELADFDRHLQELNRRLTLN